MTQFENDAQPREPERLGTRVGYYRYDRPCLYMMLWGRLIQRTVSQAATKMLTDTFHDRECGIFKAEGGCNLVGVGELVLGNRHCYLDRHNAVNGRPIEEINQELADLITQIVLRWEPMAPVQTMMEAAADVAKIPVADLTIAVTKAPNAGPFSGDALDYFFDNIRSYDRREQKLALRPYQKYVMTVHDSKTEAEVDQLWADQDLGDELLEQMNKKLKKRGGFLSVYCCSPSRHSNALRFWVNGSQNAGIEIGWRTEEEIRTFLRES